MSEPVTRRRPMIDIEEFERRARQPAAERGDGGPLSELARLVGEHEDPYKSVFAAPGHRPAGAWDGRRVEQNEREPLIGGDFAAIEAGLLGESAQRSSQAFPQREDPMDFHGADDGSQVWRYEDELDPVPFAPEEHEDEEERSRRPLYLMAAIIVAGIAGIGATFALKGGISAPTEVATIKAAPGPNKIQPETTSAAEASSQDASIVDRAPQSSSVALVNNVEQPVDLTQAQEKLARVIPLGGTRPQFDSLPSGAAAVPIPSAQPHPKPEARSGGDLGLAGQIEPKKVKVVSVAPDGTILQNPRPAQIPAQAAPAAAAPPPKAATPKTTARVITPKPAAESENVQSATTNGARSAAPKAKPVQVAEAQPEANALKPGPASGGAFAVQLAAPESEQEAREIQLRLIKKFGFHPSIRKAVNGDKTVYRVRVGNLSKEDANALCQKVQGGGGACFVARN